MNRLVAATAIALVLVSSSVVFITSQALASSNNDEDNNNDDEEQQQQGEEESITTATEFEHETCFTISLAECKEVTEKAKIHNVFLERCIVTLADGNEITVYKVKNTCLDWQTKYGGMTYQQYQDDAMTEFDNKANEARDNVGKMFAPDSPFSPSLSDKIDELTEKIDELNAGR